MEDEVELTVQEVADMHRISKQTVYRHIKSGDLPAGRVGVQLRIKHSDALDFRKPIRQGE